MRQDIKKMDTYETRTKVNTTKCRPMCELIDEAYIKDSNFFRLLLLKNIWIIQTKHNLNRPK